MKPGASYGSLVFCLLFSVFFCAAAGPAAEPVVWDFALPKATWRPRAPSISVERFSATGPGGKIAPCLRIHGPIVQGWNYANSDSVPIEAGKLYCVSAWVRVDRVGSGTPMPYLKCEFQAENRKAELGQVSTTAYDATPLGTWQELRGEFRTPDTAKSCWLAWEKGTNSQTEIDVLLADIRLTPIERFGFWDTYRLKPLPAPLEKLRGVHPRIYLTSQRIEELREKVKTTHAPLWKRIQEQADRAVKSGPPAYQRDDGHSGDEQLWQREVGNTMPLLAMAYVVTGQPQYLASARQWALASCSYPTWGLGRIDGMDLATGHQLFGLGIVYDWCYRDLDEPARREIRQTLVRRTSAMFEAVAGGKAWWQRSYLQNHLWVNASGMAVAGFALFDEVGDAACWIGLPLDKFRRTMTALGSDGASHEGVGYWEYGVEYLLKFMELARTNLGVDLYVAPWWPNTATYAQYLMLPRNAWRRDNSIVDLADCPRGHWYGPDYLLYALARRFRDGHAQWLAQQVVEANVAATGASWLNLLWYDPTLPGKPPDPLPTLHYFPDMGIVSARSGWSGDESLVVFKCGPFLGHEATGKFTYDPGGGHVHPDANHFVVFAHGEWLIRDDGYHPKWTGQHNTLLIGQRGQLGEGAEWFRGTAALGHASPKVLRAVSTPTIDQISGDATAAYPAALGLKRYVRHLLFVKPDVLLVADDVWMDKESPLELRFHTEQPASQQGNAFVAQGKRSVLRLEPLLTEGVRATSESLPLPGRHGREGAGIPTIRLETERARWRSAVALSWAGSGGEPAKVTLVPGERHAKFAVKDRTLVFDWDTGETASSTESDY